MGININDLEFFPIQRIEYERWFQSIKPNGFIPNQEQREEIVSIINERIMINSEGLLLLHDCCQKLDEEDSDYLHIKQTIYAALLYILQTTTDCMVATKFLLLADQDYDKRYARGKLKVIMNEGFKKLYGFSAPGGTDTYWGKLSSIMQFFPKFSSDFHKISVLLDEQSRTSSWWKHERDLEVHLDPIELYNSRQSELNESEVMIDTMKLIDALGIAEQFVWNLHTTFTNWLNKLYLEHPEYFKE